MIGKRTLGSPLREICTMGSERGDEYKRPCSLGEGTGSKEPDYSAAPQWATASRLVPTHPSDFLACSYGSRPGRSPHQALDEVDRILFREPVSYVLEIDIVSYFDAIVREQLMEMVERRISDTSILRLLRKWINVGVIDEGRLLVNKTGTGQGQVVSPLLANIYLHYIL